MKNLYNNIINFAFLQMDKKNFGQQYERSMYAVSNDILPLETATTTTKMNAHLSTNEWVDDTFLITYDLANPIDGYIIGVGFGHIFKMIDLFPADISPRGIICADVRPEVILAGRIIVQKLIQAESKESFFTSLYTVTTNEIDTVIQSEKNSEISRRFLESVPYIEELFNNAEYGIEIGAYLSPSIVEVLSRNFERLQDLARHNNIGVVLMDITNAHFAETIKNLPNYTKSRNIIYLSNAIDHITNRGQDRNAFKALDILKVLETTRGSICVDTTQQSLNYKLRIGSLPPTYCLCDYPTQL